MAVASTQRFFVALLLVVDGAAWPEGPAPGASYLEQRHARGDDNRGNREYFLGEVDDVLAAVEFLRKRPDVDPTRVYLGGHSTGATTVLLAAASRPSVKAVFALGPVDSIVKYGPTGTALDRANEIESRGKEAIPGSSPTLQPRSNSCRPFAAV